MKSFHLKRCGPDRTKEEAANCICFWKNITVIGRNPGQVDYVITSSNYMQNAVISRRHARVVKKKDCFIVFDDSRNGIFVNDVKIEGSQLLSEGDIVIFGHLNGEELPFGARSRQPDSEYQFLFEECCCSEADSLKGNSSQKGFGKVKDKNKHQKCSTKHIDTRKKEDNSATPKKHERKESTFEEQNEREFLPVQPKRDISTVVCEKVEESASLKHESSETPMCTNCNDQMTNSCVCNDKVKLNNHTAPQEKLTSASGLCDDTPDVIDSKDSINQNENVVEEMECDSEKEENRSSEMWPSINPVSTGESVVLVGKEAVTKPSEDLENDSERVTLNEDREKADNFDAIDNVQYDSSSEPLVTDETVDGLIAPTSHQIDVEKDQEIEEEGKMLDQDVEAEIRCEQLDSSSDDKKITKQSFAQEQSNLLNENDEFEDPSDHINNERKENSCFNSTMTSIGELEDEVVDKSTDVMNDSIEKDPDKDVTRTENTIDTLTDCLQSPRVSGEHSEDKDRTRDTLLAVHDRTLTEGAAANNAAEDSGIISDNLISKRSNTQQTFDGIENPLLTSSPAHSCSNILSLRFTGKRKFGADAMFVSEEHIKDAIAANVGATVLRLKETDHASTERPGKRIKETEASRNDAGFIKPLCAQAKPYVKSRSENRLLGDLEAHQFSDADFSDSDLAFSQKSTGNLSESETCSAQSNIYPSSRNELLESDEKLVHESGPCSGDSLEEGAVLSKHENTAILNSDDFSGVKHNVSSQQDNTPILNSDVLNQQDNTSLMNSDVLSQQASTPLLNCDVLSQQGGTPVLNSDVLSQQGGTPVLNSDVLSQQASTPVLNSDVLSQQAITPVLNSDVLSQQASTPVLNSDVLSQQASTPLLNCDFLNQQGSTPLLNSDVLSQQGGTPVLNSDVLSQQASTPVLNSDVLSQQAITPVLNSDALSQQASTPVVNSDVLSQQASTPVVNSDVLSQQGSTPVVNSDVLPDVEHDVNGQQEHFHVLNSNVLPDVEHEIISQQENTSILNSKNIEYLNDRMEEMNRSEISTKDENTKAETMDVREGKLAREVTGNDDVDEGSVSISKEDQFSEKTLDPCSEGGQACQQDEEVDLNKEQDIKNLVEEYASQVQMFDDSTEDEKAMIAEDADEIVVLEEDMDVSCEAVLNLKSDVTSNIIKDDEATIREERSAKLMVILQAFLRKIQDENEVMENVGRTEEIETGSPTSGPDSDATDIRIVLLVKDKVSNYRKRTIQKHLTKFLASLPEAKLDYSMESSDLYLDISFDFLESSLPSLDRESVVESVVADVKVEVKQPPGTDDCLMLSQDASGQSDSFGSNDHAKLNTSTLSQSQNLCLFLDSGEEDCNEDTNTSKDVTPIQESADISNLDTESEERDELSSGDESPVFEESTSSKNHVKESNVKMNCSMDITETTCTNQDKIEVKDDCTNQDKIEVKDDCTNICLPSSCVNEPDEEDEPNELVLEEAGNNKVVSSPGVLDTSLAEKNKTDTECMIHSDCNKEKTAKRNFHHSYEDDNDDNVKRVKLSTETAKVETRHFESSSLSRRSDSAENLFAEFANQKSSDVDKCEGQGQMEIIETTEGKEEIANSNIEGEALISANKKELDDPLEIDISQNEGIRQETYAQSDISENASLALSAITEEEIVVSTKEQTNSEEEFTLCMELSQFPQNKEIQDKMDCESDIEDDMNTFTPLIPSELDDEKRLGINTQCVSLCSSNKTEERSTEDSIQEDVSPINVQVEGQDPLSESQTPFEHVSCTEIQAKEPGLDSNDVSASENQADIAVEKESVGHAIEETNLKGNSVSTCENQTDSVDSESLVNEVEIEGQNSEGNPMLTSENDTGLATSVFGDIQGGPILEDNQTDIVMQSELVENSTVGVEEERRLLRSASPEFDLQNADMMEETTNSTLNTVSGDEVDSDSESVTVETEQVYRLDTHQPDRDEQDSSQSASIPLKQDSNSEPKQAIVCEAEVPASVSYDRYNETQKGDEEISDLPPENIHSNEDTVPEKTAIELEQEDVCSKSSQDTSEETVSEIVNDTEDNDDADNDETDRGCFVPETQDDDGLQARKRGLLFNAHDLPYLTIQPERQMHGEDKIAESSFENDLSQEIPFLEEGKSSKNSLLGDALELSCHFSSDSEMEFEVPVIALDNDSRSVTTKEFEFMKTQTNKADTVGQVKKVDEIFTKEDQDEVSDQPIDEISHDSDPGGVFETLCPSEQIEESVETEYGSQEQTQSNQQKRNQLEVECQNEEAANDIEAENDSLERTLIAENLEQSPDDQNEPDHLKESISFDQLEEPKSDDQPPPSPDIDIINAEFNLSRLDQNDEEENRSDRHDSFTSLISGVCQLQSSDDEDLDRKTDVSLSQGSFKREQESGTDDSLSMDGEGLRKSKKRKHSASNEEEKVKPEHVSVKKEEALDKLGSVLERILSKKRSKQMSSDDNLMPSSAESSAPSSQETPEGARAASPFCSGLADLGDMNVSRAELHVRRAGEVLEEMEYIFNRKAHTLAGNSRVEAWKRQLSNLKMKRDLPKTIIAVVGDTGCGKSSLINALLEHADMLPTSGMRACTAVVVEIVANLEDDSYRADIDFLSEKEWLDELELLLNELRGNDGVVKARPPDPQSEAGVAWSKIRAVYGHFHDGVTVGQLTRKRNVTYQLGRTKNISHRTGTLLTQQVNHYIEARETGEGGDYWPIVKHVTLRIPGCRVLSRGTVLVDLPGIRDSNAARDKIAKDFLKDCTAVWVVAGVHRAVDDRTAKELLGVHFRRQLLMDGQYGSVSFVCTKTDQIQSSEIVRSLKLADEVEPIEECIGRMSRYRIDTLQEVKQMGREMKRLDHAVTAAEKERAEHKKDAADLQEELTLGGGDSGDEYRQAAEQALVGLRNVISQNEQDCEANTAKCKQLRIEKRSKEKTLLELEKKIAQKTREVAVVCAKARNEYTKKEIRRDFRAGLKEMRRQASLDSDSDSDPSEEDQSEEGQDFGLTVENLKVFCVSATDYLKLRGKLPHDGPPQTFRKTGDTGIPGLQTFVQELTKVRKIQGTQRLLRIVGQYVSDVLSYLCDEGTLDKCTRGRAYEVFEHHLTELRTVSLRQIIESVSRDLESVLNKSIQAKTSEGAKVATEKASETANRWGSKQNREKPSEGGLHFSTYRAVINRDGAYKSPAIGPVDFNEDLAGPMYTTLTITWNQIFNNKLHQILDRCRLTIITTMKRFASRVRQDLILLEVATERIDRVYIQQLSSASNKLIDTNNELKEYITERQREISRTLTPAVQQSMLGAYSLCREEVGPGCFNRMKSHVTGQIDQHKQTMFDDASRQMLDQMLQLHAEMVGRLDEVVTSLLSDLTTLYEPLWEAPVNTKMLRQILLPKILECNRTLEVLLQEAGVELEHRSGDEGDLFASQQSREILHNSLHNNRLAIQNSLSNKPTERLSHNKNDRRNSTGQAGNVLVYDRQKQEEHPRSRKKARRYSGSNVKSSQNTSDGCQEKTSIEQGRNSSGGSKTKSLVLVSHPIKVERVQSADRPGSCGSVSDGIQTEAYGSSASASSHVNTQIGTPSFPDSKTSRSSPSRLSSSYKKKKLEQAQKKIEVTATVSRPCTGNSSVSSNEKTKNAAVKSYAGTSKGKSTVSSALSDKTNVSDRPLSNEKKAKLQAEQQRLLALKKKTKQSGSGLLVEPQQRHSEKVHTEWRKSGSGSEGVKVKAEPMSPKSSNKRKKQKTYDLVDLTESTDEEELPPMKRFLGHPAT